MSKVIFTHALCSDLAAHFEKNAIPKKLVLCIDETVDRYFGTVLCLELRKESFTLHKSLVPASERSKSLAVANRLYGEWAKAGVDRSYTVVAVGGGVVGDLAGFLAASYMRGLRLVHVPTTLLAMVDSAIGGKVALNHPAGKNLIGFFYEAEATLIEIAFLRSLPERDMYSGLAEVLKYALISDEKFLTFFEKKFEDIIAQRPALLTAIKKSVAAKQRIVKKDFKETSGLRAVLNFGHTFAHALEKLARYKHLRHGEAVLFGMLCASALSHRMGKISSDELQRIVHVVSRFKIKEKVVKAYFLGQSEYAILEAMQADKKKQNNSLRFVLLEKIGKAYLSDELVEKEQVRSAIKDAKAMWRSTHKS
ncbi:MAG: 3-dehydroquinate synthase [Candidatus Thermochlorobacter sp.]